MAVTMACILLLFAGFGLLKFVTAGPSAYRGLLVGFGLALAWYGVVQALSASRKSKSGAVSGFVWPVAFALIAIALLTPHGSPLHEVAVALNFVNPLAYLSSASMSVGSTNWNFVGSDLVLPLSILGRIIGLYVLAAVGMLAAVLQWKRLEA